MCNRMFFCVRYFFIGIEFPCILQKGNNKFDFQPAGFCIHYADAPMDSLIRNQFETPVKAAGGETLGISLTIYSERIRT